MKVCVKRLVPLKPRFPFLYGSVLNSCTSSIVDVDVGFSFFRT